MRLTDKNKTYMTNQLTKLRLLEDIEEELGIDLVPLFKALKNGIYVKNRKNEIRRVSCNIGLVETGGHNSLGLRFDTTKIDDFNVYKEYFIAKKKYTTICITRLNLRKIKEIKKLVGFTTCSGVLSFLIFYFLDNYKSLEPNK